MGHATCLDMGIVDSSYIFLGSMSIMFIERMCWDATARSSGTFLNNFVLGQLWLSVPVSLFSICATHGTIIVVICQGVCLLSMGVGVKRWYCLIGSFCGGFSKCRIKRIDR